jgi:hypothetical protein
MKRIISESALRSIIRAALLSEGAGSRLGPEEAWLAGGLPRVTGPGAGRYLTAGIVGKPARRMTVKELASNIVAEKDKEWSVRDADKWISYKDDPSIVAAVEELKMPPGWVDVWARGFTRPADQLGGDEIRSLGALMGLSLYIDILMDDLPGKLLKRGVTPVGDDALDYKTGWSPVAATERWTPPQRKIAVEEIQKLLGVDETATPGVFDGETLAAFKEEMSSADLSDILRDAKPIGVPADPFSEPDDTELYARAEEKLRQAQTRRPDEDSVAPADAGIPRAPDIE